ncbi:MAG: SGNH/GDSL hydrolase family protein [Sphingobacteriaceae bacterium]
MRVLCFVLGIIAFFQQQLHAQAKLQPFKAGDRVVFAGNSITEAGLYGSYIWLYYMTHFPDRKISVHNAGIGGDVAGQIYSRLEGDILAKKPTVLAVTFGMNDSRYFEYNSPNPKVDEFVKTSHDSYLKIENELQQLKGVKKVLMSSPPYDETVKLKEGNLFKGKGKTIEKIIEFQKSSAIKNNWSFVDFYYPMTEINVREQRTNPSYTNTGPDRIHPGSAGHFIMAYLFLKAQGLSNNYVADVNMNYTSGKLVKATNAMVNSIIKTDNGIKFDYLANSLPYPIDTVPRVWMNQQVQSEALQVIPFNDEFNNERLVVKGLPVSSYTIKIDGKEIAQVSSEELSDGINLAVFKNAPQYQQALKILALNNERKEIEGKFRNYYWVNYNFLKEKGMLFNHSDAARDTILKHAPTNGWLNAKKDDWEAIRMESSRKQLEDKMNALISRIYTINKPVKRVVSISPAF